MLTKTSTAVALLGAIVLLLGSLGGVYYSRASQESVNQLDERVVKQDREMTGHKKEHLCIEIDNRLWTLRQRYPDMSKAPRSVKEEEQRLTQQFRKYGCFQFGGETTEDGKTDIG